MKLSELIGSETWATVARKCLFNDIVDATLAHLRETKFIDVRTSKYYPLKQYWTDFATSRGMPNDPKILHLFWMTVSYVLLNEKETLLRDQIRATFLTLPSQSQSRLGITPSGTAKYRITQRTSEKPAKEWNHDLDDIPQF